MRERIFDLMRRYGIEEETIQEKYLLEVIDEAYQIFCYVSREFDDGR